MTGPWSGKDHVLDMDMPGSQLGGGGVLLTMDTPRLDSLLMADWEGEAGCNCLDWGEGDTTGVLYGDWERDLGPRNLGLVISEPSDLGIDMLGLGNAKGLLAPAPGRGQL